MFGLTPLYSMLAAALVSVVVTVPITIYATSLPYKVEIAKLEKKQADSDRDAAILVNKKVAETLKGISKAANELLVENAAFRGTLDGLSTELINGQKIHPLPANCRLDAFRLRNLTEAIDRTNAAVRYKSSN